MSFSFYIHNAHFALELIGAVVFLMAAWLTFDTYTLRREAATLTRAIGLSFCALFEIIQAVNSGSDILSYLAFALFIIGLLLIALSFVAVRKLAVNAVLVFPAFSAWDSYLHAAVSFLSLVVALASFRHGEREYNKTWRPFSLGFLLLALGLLVSISARGDESSMLYVGGDVVVLVGLASVARWVWQFLALRIRESLILIFISVSLFLATIVTLAFSTILIGQVTAETNNNLLANARVLDLDVQSLKQEALAKAQLIAQSPDLKTAVSKNDFPSLEQITEGFLESDALGFVTVTDPNGAVLVRANALSRRGDTLVGERTIEEAQQGTSFVTIEESPVEKLSIRAGSPIVVAGKTIGIVIAGYPLDNAFVDNLKRITGLDMFVYEGGTSVAASAFATDGRTRLVGVSAPASALSGTLQSGGTLTARGMFLGSPYLASYLPLINGDGKTIGMLSSAKSEQDILDIENATNRLTLITIVLIMLILALPLYLLTKRLTAQD